MSLIDREQLLAAITTIGNVVGGRSDDGIGLICDGDTFTVQAWHQKHRHGRVMFYVDKARPFSGVMSGQRLKQLLSTIDDSQLDIGVTASKGKQQLVVKGTSCRFTLAMSGDIDEMPPIEDVQAVAEFSISARDLVRSLSCALPMCVEESARFAYGGVHIAVGTGDVVFTGTDGRRLLTSPRTPIARSGGIIAKVVPRETVRAVVASLRSEKAQTVQVRIGEKSTQFVCEGLLIGSANLEGRYPDTRAILKNANTGFIQETALGYLQQMARLASTMLTAEETGMKVTVGAESITAEVEAPMVGDCVLVMTEGDRDRELLTKFDVKYLRECLSVFDPNEKMQWFQADGGDPAYFHLPDGIVYVQMPMELQT